MINNFIKIVADSFSVYQLIVVSRQSKFVELKLYISKGPEWK